MDQSVTGDDPKEEKIKRIVELYRKNGVRGVRSGLSDYLYFNVWKPFSTRWWKWRGKREIRVRDVSAIFHTRTEAEVAATRGERQVLADLINELRSDDVFFDVGANIGVYSCLASEIITEGDVIAFEPFPPNAASLRANVSLNRSEVTILERALSDSESVIRMGSTQTESPVETASFSDEGYYKIDAVRGDAMIESDEIPQPTVVKIDVEGAEPLVIEGIKTALKRPACRVVYCEVHLPSEGRPSIDSYGTSLDDIQAELRACGFSLEVINRRVSEIHLKAIRRD